MYNALKCKKCGKCIDVCPHHALSASENGINVDRTACTACASCAEACSWEALRISGYEISACDAANRLLEDHRYYETSGGGVTFSGGEATMQSDFIIDVCSRLRQEGISTALETCGMCSPETFEQVALCMDEILFDIKLLDPALLKKYTGGSLDIILKNLQTAAASAKTTVRIPLIPTVNMNDTFYSQLADMLKEIPVSSVELLPYHRLGTGKNVQLGMDVWETELSSHEENEKVQETLSKMLKCQVKLNS